MARHAALSVLAAARHLTGGFAALANTPRVQFLCLHHVFEEEQAAFGQMLDSLSQTHQFISYSDAVERILTGHVDQPYLVVTFDDGFKSCITAANVMHEIDIQGMFFVCGSSIEPESDEQLAQHCRRRLHVPPVEHMDWADLQALLDQGHEIGAHTMTHPNLAAVSIEQARAEIGQSRQLLVSRLGRADHFAWPFGPFDMFSAQCAQAVFEASFQSCASAVRGAHAGGDAIDDHRRLCVRRDHVVAKWPLAHVRCFLARNCDRPLPVDELWPVGWLPSILNKSGIDTVP